MLCETRKPQADRYLHLNILCEQCHLACRLFGKHRFQDGGQTLVSATSGIKNILLEDDPMTLPDIFSMVMNMFRWRRGEIALTVLRHISALGKLYVGVGHPLVAICGWLASTDPSQLEEVIAKCSQSTGDHFESIIGPMNRSTLFSRLRHIQRVRDKCRKGFLLQDLLRKCEATLGFPDRRTLEFRLSLAFHHFNQRDYVVAANLGRDIVAQAQHLERQGERTHFHCEGPYIIARSQYALGEIYLAEAHLHEAIELLTSHFGVLGVRVKTWLVQLEEWLVARGQLSSDTQVRKRWTGLLRRVNDFNDST